LLLSGSAVLLLSRCTTLEGCLSLLEELVEADGLVACVLASIFAVVLAVVLAVVNIAGVLGSLAFACSIDEGGVLSGGGTLSFSFSVVLSLTSLTSLALSFALTSFSGAIGSSNSAKGDIGGGGASSI
jgi:hypothetical protein